MARFRMWVINIYPGLMPEATAIMRGTRLSAEQCLGPLSCPYEACSTSAQKRHFGGSEVQQGDAPEPGLSHGWQRVHSSRGPWGGGLRSPRSGVTAKAPKPVFLLMEQG